MTQKNFVLMLRGNFYVSSGKNLVLDDSPGLSRSEVSSLGEEPHLILSKAALKSLIDSALEPQSTMYLHWQNSFEVADLQDLIDGFSNAFEENQTVEIDSHVLKVQELTFDDTFGNIAFKLTQIHEFKNPIEPRFLSAEVITAQQGVLELKLTEKLDFEFKIEVKQERVIDFKPFFQSETTKEEFREEWKASYSQPILDQFNKQLSSGVRLPFGHT